MKKIYLSLLSSDFSGEDAEKVEYASIVGYAVDSASKKEKLEGVFLCYMPFYAIRLKNSDFMIFNAFKKTKTALTQSTIPTINELKEKLANIDDYSYAQYTELKKMLVPKSGETVEVTGALSSSELDGIAKLITKHQSSVDNRFKALKPLLNQAEAQREAKVLASKIVSTTELDDQVRARIDFIEQSYSKAIDTLQARKKEIERQYAQEIEKTKQEIKTKLEQMKKELAQRQSQIEKELAKKKSEIISNVKTLNNWKTLKTDFEMLSKSFNGLSSTVSSVSKREDIEKLVSVLSEIREHMESFRANINSTIRTLNDHSEQIVDAVHLAKVEKQNAAERNEQLKEDEKRRIEELKDEKEAKLSDIDAKIDEIKQVLKEFKKERKALEDKIKQGYTINAPSYISSDFLEVAPEENLALIYVPVAVCQYKEKTKLNFRVLPPVEIAQNMKKIKSLPIKSSNNKIGFECLGIEAKTFVKELLEKRLAESTDLQGEIRGENNEFISTGGLEKFDAGLKLLQQQKKFPKKNADALIALYREL